MSIEDKGCVNMQEKRLKRRMQKSVALASMASFLLMPVNVAYGANNNITAGNSGIGSLTQITGGQTDFTKIESHFKPNGTGINHFGNFDVNGTAELTGANRYVNMVNSMVNINGLLNAFKEGGKLPANVMFISPEGMAVGAGGVLNVGGLQVITPNATDYQNLIKKAGTDATNITLTESDFANLKNGGDGLILIGGKIYSTDDVVIGAGNGIYFQNGGLIDTTTGIGEVKGIGSISLFTNTGDIVGSNTIHLDSSGNIVLSAKNGGIGQGKIENQNVYGEKVTITPFNVKLAEGKTLNVEVSDTLTEAGDFKGYASVANNSANLNVGTVKGSNIKITNNGYGTLATTEAISGVDKIYLNAEKGLLNVEENISAKEIVRLNGKVGVEAEGNLEVTDAGYISVYSNNGSISMNDASLKSGNIDIKANGGDVEVGNLTITERANAEGVLRLQDNTKLSTGVKAPDTFRFDGVHVTATNGDLIQKEGTNINSAGRVDLTAGGSVSSTVKAVDIISATAKGNVNLVTLDTSRLGDISAANIDIKGNDILVDGKVKGDKIDVVATDKLTIRPNFVLDAEYGHRTYGALEAKGDVNVSAQNGILATEPKSNGAMITSLDGNINLDTNGDIKTLSGDDNKISVDAAGKVNADGDNVNLQLKNPNGGIGVVQAKTDANIGADGDVNVAEKVVAGNNLIIDAKGSINQDVPKKLTFESGKDMILKSEDENVGDPAKYLQVQVGGELNAEALNGGVYINGNGNLNVNGATAGKNVNITATDDLVIDNVSAGNKANLEAGKNLVATDIAAKAGANLEAGNNLSAQNVKVSDGNAQFDAGADLTLKSVEALNTGKIIANAQGTANVDNLNGSYGVVVESKGDMAAGLVVSGDELVLSTDGNLKANELRAVTDIELNVGKDADIVYARAQNDVKADVTGELKVGTIEGWENVNLTAGEISQSELEGANGVFADGDATLKATSGDIGAVDNKLKVATNGNLNAVAKAEDASVNLNTKGEVNVGAIEAAKDVNIEQDGHLIINDSIKAANDVVIAGEGSILQVQDKAKVPAILAGKDMTLESAKGDIGEGNNYLTVEVGNELSTATPNGDTYIKGIGNLDVANAESGKDVSIIASGALNVDNAEAANNISLDAGKNVDVETAVAGNDIVVESGEDVIVGDKVSAGNDLTIDAKGSINQETPDKVSFESGNDMTLNSAEENVGDPAKYLQVSVGGELNAEAPNGGVYIGTPEDLTIGKIEAGQDVVVDAIGSILQSDDLVSKPAISAGNDITLTSQKEDVGAKDNFLTVDFGGQLDVKAEEGSAYIEGMGALDIDSIVAAEDLGVRTPESIIADNVNAGRDLILESGKDVELGTATAGNDIEIKAGEDVLVKDIVKAGNDLTIESEGSINQETPDKVAFESGNDMTLNSAEENVGDPAKYLQVSVGGELNAEAPNGGVYIGTPEDLTIGEIKAGTDVVVDSDEDVILGNIDAGNNVIVDAESIKVVEGTVEPAIEAGKDVDLTARAGDIGTLENEVTVKAGGEINATAKADDAEGEKGDINLGLLDDSAVIGTVDADNDVNIDAINDVLVKDVVKAGNDLTVDAQGSINQETPNKVSFESGNDMTLNSAEENVGDPAKYLQVSVGGELNAEAPNGGVYIGTPEDLTIGKIEAAQDVVVDAEKDVLVKDVVKAGNDLTIEAEGSINQETPDKVAFESGNDMTLNSAQENVGDPEKYLQVQVGGELSAEAPNGGVYIGSPEDLVIDKVIAGKDVEIKTQGDLVQAENPANPENPAIISGGDMVLESAKEDVGDPENYLQVQVGGELTATAPEGGVYIGSPDDLVIDKVEAGKDVEIKTQGDLVQAENPANPENPAIISGGDMVLESAKEDVGDPENYLQVQVGGELTAEAPEGGVYIGSKEDLVIDKIVAKEDVAIKGGGDVIQAAPADMEDPRIIAGDDLIISSDNEDVGDPENYLQVQVGGEITADAPNGGVYIGSKDDLVIDKIEAGKDVEIKTEGDLVQAENPANPENPAIISGGDMVLESAKEDVGDPENYLQVQVGGELTAEAPEGGVYIGSPEDLVIDKIVAKDDVVIEGEKDVVQADPADPEDPRIITEGDLIISSDQEDVGDPENYLQVDVGGDIIAEAPNGGVYIGQPEDDAPVVVPGGSGEGDSFDLDDNRDQRNMKYLTDDDNNDASVRNNRQHLRYNVANSDYILMGSSSESGAQVQEVINISKQGMLVQTNEALKVGENIEVTMDYKGLPFTVEGKVVRTDDLKGTAGVEFNNIDRLTSSLILYLGMMVNR